MANDSITTVLSVVAWGTKLTFGLYDFSTSNSRALNASASQDVSRLAKEVNLLSQVLRQIGSRLKEDEALPSPEAFDIVRAVLGQCQDVFREIEGLVPLGGQQGVSSRPGSYDGSSPQQQVSRPGSYDGSVQQVSRPGSYEGSPLSQSAVMVMSPWREEVDWNAVVQARAQYLLAHLEALKLTMSVMLQTLYTAKAIVWAKYDNHQTAHEAVDVEKLQTESLVIEQQLALFRAYRLHDSFRWHMANTPLQIKNSPQSQALVKYDSEYGLNPGALVPYQDPSLAAARPSASEIEDLSRVRMISSPYVELLLSTWTRMHIIEEHLRLDQQRPREERRRDKYQQRRNWQAPAVESDSEDNDNAINDPWRPPKLNLATNEPVLMHVNEPQFVSSPISASAVPRSAATLQPPGGPFSPQPSHSWGPTSGTYFPQNMGNGSNTSRRRVSPGPSPLASPRVSFSSDGAGNPPERVRTAFKVDQKPQPPSSQQPHSNANAKAQLHTQNQKKIPYRLRINQWYWDYADATLVNSNQHMSPQQAIKTVSKDTQPITEIFQEYVSREAIRKEGLEYTRVMRERIVGGDGVGGGGNGGRKVEEQCYCVEGALRPDDVKRLVERTRRIRGEPKPRSPPLDRSNTAPVYGNKFRETHQREFEAATRNAPNNPRSNTSNSNTSDEDAYSNYKTSSSSSTSRPRSKSGHGHDSPRGNDDDYHRRGSSSRTRSRGGDRDRGEKRKSSSGKMQTATKIAAGAGLATLLDGLPEMLSYL